MSTRTGPARRRTLAAVALCFVIALVGCSGLSGVGDDGPGDNGPTDDEIVTQLANVSETHAEYLRSVNNVTVVRTVEVSSGGQTLKQRTQWQIDFDSGRAYKSTEPLGGSDSEEFQTANGTVYKRFGTGPRQFVPPEQTEPLAIEQAVTLATPVDSAGNFYERRGTRTVDGVEATVYVADDYGAAPDGYRENLTTASVERFRSVVVVAPSGYVINETATLTVSSEGRTRSITETVRFTPGQTSVKDPEWLDEAKTQARKPGPGDVVARTYNATGGSGLVELNVSAEKQELDPPATVGPQISENPTYRNELLDSVRVGSVARYYFLLDTVERVDIRIHYDQSQIAPENESELRVAVRNDTTGWWDLLNTTVDEDRNIVTATITDPGNLETYQGETMIAMRFEEFVKRLREQSRR